MTVRAPRLVVLRARRQFPGIFLGLAPFSISPHARRMSIDWKRATLGDAAADGDQITVWCNNRLPSNRRLEIIDTLHRWHRRLPAR